MSVGFQADTFQTTGFQSDGTGTPVASPVAFQPDAFQLTGFQTSAATSKGGGVHHKRRRRVVIWENEPRDLWNPPELPDLPEPQIAANAPTIVKIKPAPRPEPERVPELPRYDVEIALLLLAA